MRAGVCEQKVLFQNKFKFIYNGKNDGLMKMTPLTIVHGEPVSPCIAMVEGGLTLAQIARKQASDTDI